MFLIVAGLFYLDYTWTKAENLRLESEIIKSNQTINALENVLAKDAKSNKKESELIHEIEKSPKSDDANTAPVLLRAIERLRDKG